MRESKTAGPAPGVRMEALTIRSEHLDREVSADLYLPALPVSPSSLSLLLVNDGQDLPAMGFGSILERLYRREAIRPILCVGIHAGMDRRNEYGTAGIPDHLGRGAKAAHYTDFIFGELLPEIRQRMGTLHFREKAFCGFSLGGLMALDIVWNHPQEFRHVGVFSGSLWWRSRALDDGYDESRDRIMHDRIRTGEAAPWLRFFLQAGLLDETADRNGNGVIDSVDDMRDLILELEAKGYTHGRDIHYLELPDGRHDVHTWGRAFPEFLRWAFGA
ncbi:MAG: esterase [Chitinophagia bacterium]|nr:esterase [Chitinophagia bacterium]